MRTPRFDIIHDGATVHLTWRCHEGTFYLTPRWAKQLYYDLFLQHKRRYGVEVRGYSIMDNHIHITMFMKNAIEFSRFLQYVHSIFVVRYNRLAGRDSSLMRDRPKTKLIQNEEQELNTLLYGDTNPTRTELALHPEQWEFSSYHYYAEGKPDPLLDESPCYTALGETAEARRAVYREQLEGVVEKIEEHRPTFEELAGPGNFLGETAWVKEQELRLQRCIEERRVRRAGRRDYPPPWNAGLGTKR